MQKLLLPGFGESELSNRFIDPQEDLSESMDMGDCSAQVFILGFRPGEKRETHTHDEVRLTFVRSGRMKLIMEDKTLEVGPGGFISTLPHVPHSLEVISEEPLRLIEIVVPTSCKE